MIPDFTENHSHSVEVVYLVLVILNYQPITRPVQKREMKWLER